MRRPTHNYDEGLNDNCMEACDKFSQYFYFDRVKTCERIGLLVSE